MISKRKIDEVVDRELMSAQEAADELGTSIANIYYWIGQDELDCMIVGKHKLLYRSEIEKRKNEK